MGAAARERGRSIDGRVEFRVWAPRPESVAVAVGNDEIALDPVGYGIYEVVAPARAGDDYWFCSTGAGFRIHVRGGSRTDCAGLPASRRLVAPQTPEASPAPTSSSSTSCTSARSREAGTFEGAIPYLRELAELGVTAIEIMPVAEFPGARGWGYDGVYI